MSTELVVGKIGKLSDAISGAALLDVVVEFNSLEDFLNQF